MQRFLALVGVALALVPSGALGIPQGVERSTVLTQAGQAAESYDYVIVGGGQSGLTVAARLTEDGKTTVLVIEYGELHMCCAGYPSFTED